jgi:hypothetical protein
MDKYYILKRRERTPQVRDVARNLQIFFTLVSAGSFGGNPSEENHIGSCIWVFAVLAGGCSANGDSRCSATTTA